jgi:hypothetical protein
MRHPIAWFLAMIVRTLLSAVATTTRKKRRSLFKLDFEETLAQHKLLYLTIEL